MRVRVICKEIRDRSIEFKEERVITLINIKGYHYAIFTASTSEIKEMQCTRNDDLQVVEPSCPVTLRNSISSNDDKIPKMIRYQSICECNSVVFSSGTLTSATGRGSGGGGRAG